ncbi:hypothetical protein Q5P01_012272 [Channa striata]|uniref:Uncharacterized protein n=1 Tax=Channa striata TaxID=64152 RepID=A0AA88MN79_CHASR|nr:hypothetical protein Q5P01_012272 [Channa striata]
MIELHHPSHRDPLSLPAPPPWSPGSPAPVHLLSLHLDWNGWLTLSLSSWRRGNLRDLLGETEQSCGTAGTAEAPWGLRFGMADDTSVRQHRVGVGVGGGTVGEE